VIPLRDVIPSRTTPFLTVAIIAVNAVAFFYELSLSRRELTLFLQEFGVVPAAFTPASLVTSMFLHGGWMHFIGNMLYLWIFGDNVEDRLGHARFLVFYFLCGFIAALGQTWMDPYSTVPMIGASGAIAGVMGAYLVLYPRSRVLTLIPLIIIWEIIELPAVFLLGFWFLMQLFSAGAIATTAQATSGGVAFMAHVAGFVAGTVGVFLFRKRRRPDAWWLES
jgi:membrane associated rhomboid family serine protease